MPWQESTRMSLRLEFCVLADRLEAPMSALCRQYGISRKTGYKWLARYRAEGNGGLAEQSRRPHTRPHHQTPVAIEEPTPMSPIAGQLVTETFEYGGGRQVTAYVPPAPPEAIVFAGDGQLIAPWGGVLEAADLPPTMIIGAHRAGDETLRLHEYSPGESTAAFAFDPERFAAHEEFFVEDVRRWAKSHFSVVLPAERTAVFGVSASGEFALAMGLRHPDIYGARSCARRRVQVTDRLP
jgi:hypothetical protein